jgi:metal-sulfur cluster biosynthetic enzyme
VSDAADPGGDEEPSADPFAESGPQYCAYTEYREGEPREGLPRTGAGATGIEGRVWDALRAVEDPEMPVSVVDLGLIYGIYVDRADGHARVDMTLTYTGCPARDYLLSSVETAVESVDGVETAVVNLVWSPEWSVAMVTDAGREALREFGVSV